MVVPLVAGRHPGRQLGDQEVDILRMVGGITKYAVLVTDPRSIRYHLERALHLAAAGRPGPCWLDVPIDVQSSPVDPEDLPGYDPAEDDPRWDLDGLRARCREVLARLRAAERPVVLAGTGVRLAGALEAFHAVIRRLGIPVVGGVHTHFPRYMRHYGGAWLEGVAARYLRAFHNRTAATVVATADLRRQLERDGYRNVHVVGRGVEQFAREVADL